jgi:hypothetical protein
LFVHDLHESLRRVDPARNWQRMHELFLAERHAVDEIDWSPALLDSGTANVPLGGTNRAPTRRTAVAWEVDITC